MKKITMLMLIVAFIASSMLKAQVSEYDYVKKWKYPITTHWFFPGVKDYVAHPHKQLLATQAPAGFDPSAAGFDFNKYWNGIPVQAGNINMLNQGVNSANKDNRKGGDDFVGEIRAMYDQYAVYIFLKARDDQYTGRERFELALSPYYKVDALLQLHPDTASYAYLRYTNLGAFKATMVITTLEQAAESSFSNAMIITNTDNKFPATGPAWADPYIPAKNNIQLYSHTAAGADTIKIVFSIGYAALSGDPNGPRSFYGQETWKSAVHTDSQGDGSKYTGFSFDIKVSDADNDDVKVDNELGGDYWWNTTNNDAYALNFYAGFIGPSPSTGVSTPKADIFGTVTSNKVEFKAPVDAVVYNTIGKAVISAKQVESVDLSSLSKGVYIVTAKNASIKVIRN